MKTHSTKNILIVYYNKGATTPPSSFGNSVARYNRTTWSDLLPQKVFLFLKNTYDIHYSVFKQNTQMHDLDVYGGFPQPKLSLAITTAYPFSLKVRSNASYLDSKR